MAKETTAQAEVMDRVMHEYKHGELKTNAGAKVKDRRQAVAIALSEAGESNQVDAKTNRRRLATTKRRERQGGTGKQRAEGDPTKAELYERARKRNIAGRSTMSKAALERALKA